MLSPNQLPDPLRFFFGGGTFAPAARASDSPIAIACSRLFTFFPDLPERSSPSFISRMARSTFSPAFSEYLRPELLPREGDRLDLAAI
jgi:hypothetical protein